MSSTTLTGTNLTDINRYFPSLGGWNTRARVARDEPSESAPASLPASMNAPAPSTRPTTGEAAGTLPAFSAPSPTAASRDEALSPHSDAALVARAGAGDMAAFRVLVERYQRPMAALVARMTDNPDDVDDIVQELFIRAWKGLPKFRGDAQFSTWLYRIGVNTAIKHRSRRKGDTTHTVSAEALAGGMEQISAPSFASPEQGGDPFHAAEKREREEAIRKAVASLPEKQRTVVVLHYFEGHSCEEISQIVGCSLGTVWSRLHYACKRLKGVLETPGSEYAGVEGGA
jgi:RNA polymerase sigma-70 factor (ECF subfamily)